MKYRYRWTHQEMKKINGCAIYKTTDHELKKTTYDVKDLDSRYLLIPTIGQFATLKEARECARKVKR